MANTVSKEDVKKIEELCKLTLTPEEVEKYSDILTDIVEVIGVLSERDVENVEPTDQVTGLTNVYMNGDDNRATLTKEEVLKNSANVVKGMFSTKAVFDR